MQVAYSSLMEGESLRRARRRKKLETLLKEIGGAAQAETDTGTPRTHFVALTKGRRGLGDDLAAKLESAYDKPAGWFDSDEADYWPFSIDLQQKVLLLSDEELRKAENVLRAHLGLEQISASDFTNTSQLPYGSSAIAAYPRVMEEGAELLDQADVPAPRKHGRKTVRGPSHQKGGGGT